MSDEADILTIREVRNEAGGSTRIIMPDGDELVAHDWREDAERVRVWKAAETTARQLARSIGANVVRERLTDQPKASSQPPFADQQPDPPPDMPVQSAPRKGFFSSFLSGR